MKVKAKNKSVKIHRKITDFTEFHGNTEMGVFSQKKANFTENVTAVKS